MKHPLFVSVCITLVFGVTCTPLSLMAQQPKTGNETATFTEIQATTLLKQSKWDLDRLTTKALSQVSNFTQGIGNNIKRASLVRIDGDEYVNINVVRLKYKLQDALLKSGKLQLVECRQCNNTRVFVEENSLIISRAVETNAQMAKLGKELNIDAYIQGVASVNESDGIFQLILQLVDVKNGTILKSTILEAKE